MVILLLACIGTKPEPKPDTGSEPDTETGETSESGETAAADADGDGYDAESAGGDDCDDGHTGVHPGATEWCDARDWDCDGQALSPGVCAADQDMVAMATWVFVEAAGARVYRSAAEGDRFVARPVVEDALLMYDQTANVAESEWDASSAAYVLLETTWPDADWDGDGVEDLVLTSATIPGVWVHRGPFEPGQQGRYAEDADFQLPLWSGLSARLSSGGHDVTGDGISDVAMSCEGGSYGTCTDDFAIVPGGSLNDVGVIRLPGVGSAGMTLVGDLTGDGISEAKAEGPGWEMVILDDVAERDGVSAAESPLATVRDGEWVQTVNDAFDWNGDGVNELFVFGYANDDHNDEGRACFVTDVVGEIDGSDQAACFSSTAYTMGGPILASDNETVFLGAESGRTSGGVTVYAGVFAMPFSDGPPVGIVDLDSRRGIVYVDEGYSSQTGDVNGDGFSDLVVRQTGGGVGYLPGWEIPWDEAVWWE